MQGMRKGQLKDTIQIGGNEGRKENQATERREYTKVKDGLRL